MEKTCEHCSATFTIKPSKADRKRYCSTKCRKEHEATIGRLRTRKEGVKFSCKHCGKIFEMGPSYVTAYRKKFGRDPLYCSMPCADAGRVADSAAKNVFICKQCGKECSRAIANRSGGSTRRYDYKKVFCGVPCKAAYQRAQFRKKFEAGEFTRRVHRGYVKIRLPGGDGRREVFEHRLVMERILGRPLLREETVHHRSGDKTDNGQENLQLFCKNHGPGQAVEDAIAWAINMIARYPDFARKQGYILTKIDS